MDPQIRKMEPPNAVMQATRATNAEIYRLLESRGIDLRLLFLNDDSLMELLFEAFTSFDGYRGLEVEFLRKQIIDLINVIPGYRGLGERFTAKLPPAG